jgi:hypothetical protein
LLQKISHFRRNNSFLSKFVREDPTFISRAQQRPSFIIMAPFRGSSISEDNEDVISELLDEQQPTINNHNNNSSSSNQWRERIRRVLESPLVRGTAATALLLLLSWIAVRHRRPNKRLLSNPNQRRRQRQQHEDAVSVPLSLLIQMVQEGRLEKILLSTSRIFFRGGRQRDDADDASSAWRKIDLPNNSALQNRIYSLLARTKADISTITEPTDYMSHMATGCFAVMPFVYLALVYRMMNRQVGGDDSTGTKGIVRGGRPNNDPNVVTFRDVAGIDSVVEEVREVVDYLKNPARYHQVGATTPSGVLVGTRTWRRYCCVCFQHY